MVWVRTTRITLLISLLVAAAVLAWLAAHPTLYSGHLSRAVTRNLLRDTGAAFNFRDLAGNPLNELTFYQVSITRAGDDGSFLYLTADSLRVSYRLDTLLRRKAWLRELELSGPSLLLRRGTRGTVSPSTDPLPPRAAPAFGVERVVVDDFSMILAAADGTPLEQADGVHWEGAVRPAGDAVVIRTDRGRGHWVSRDLTVHEAQLMTTVRPSRIELTRATVRSDSTDATVDMVVELADGGGLARMELQGEARAFSLRELIRGLGGDEAPRLRAEGRCSIELADDVLRIQAVGSGELERAPFIAERFEGVLRDGELEFERIVGGYLGVQGDVTGRVDTEDGLLELRGVARRANLADPWTGEDLGWPSSDLAGRFEVRVGLEAPAFVDLSFEEASGMLLELPVDSLHARLHWDELQGLRLDEGRVRVLGTRLRGSGTIDADDQAEIIVQARADSLSPWVRRLGLPVDGDGLAAAGRLHGPVDSLALRVGGELATLRAARLTGDDNQFLLEMDRFDRFDRLRAQVTSRRVLAGPRELGSLEVHLDRRAPFTRIGHLVLAVADSSLHGSGSIEEVEGGFHVELDSLEVTLGEDRWHLARRARAEMVEGRFASQGLEIVSETGRLVYAGSFTRDGAVDLALQLEDVELGLLRRLGLIHFRIEGAASAALLLQGTIDDPQGDLSLELVDGAVEDRRVGELDMKLGLDGPRLTVHRLEDEGPYGQLSVEGELVFSDRGWLRVLLERPEEVGRLWEGASVDAALRSSGLQPAHWLDPGAPVGSWGHASGSLNVKGPTVDPVVLGSLVVEDLPAGLLTVPRLTVGVRADREGLHLVDGVLEPDGPWVSFGGRLPVRLTLTGAPTWETDRGVELRIDSEGEVALEPFRRFWPQLRRLKGSGTLEFVARGDPRQPELSGSVRFQDAEVGLQGWSEELREARIVGTFQGDRLVLSTLEAREGLKGRISGSGEVVFRGLLPDDISLDLVAERVLIASVPHLTAIGTSDDLRLRLVRPAPDVPRAPLITGHVEVDKAIYTGEFTESGEGQAIGATFTPDWMADLQIRAVDRVQISNQSAELRVEGDVDFVRDVDGLRLRGTVDIPQGRVPLFNNDFTIIDGTLDFSRRPLEPEVDITAETEVPIYDPAGGLGRELERITVHLTGTFAEPVVDFESESGLDENSIVRLLAGFRTPSGDAQLGAELGDVGFRAGLNFLERALAQEIRGIDTIDIETEEAAVDEVGGTRIAVGKYISDTLYVRFSQGLSIAERDLFLEYQISRRLLFTSEVKRRLREDGAQSQFNIDFKYRVKY